MKSRPVIVSATNSTSTPAKRTLFRIALTVAMAGAIAVSTILILQGGLALGRLRYFVDIGIHPLHVTSVILLVFGLLALLTFIILTIGIIKVNKTFAVIAAGLLSVCSLGLIAFSIWSFLTISSTHLPASLNSTITKELDETRYVVGDGNIIIVNNTNTMARLEKQHQCCGFADPVNDYKSRRLAALSLSSPSSSSSSSGSSNKGRSSSTQRNTASSGSSVLLPISCCNEKYRSADNLCIDGLANNTNPSNHYNTDGCYGVVARYKFKHIHQQGFTTVVAGCLAVISCIALAAVIRLLGEGYQILPLRTAM